MRRAALFTLLVLLGVACGSALAPPRATSSDCADAQVTRDMPDAGVCSPLRPTV
jgi:hypothetical protein